MNNTANQQEARPPIPPYNEDGATAQVKKHFPVAVVFVVVLVLVALALFAMWYQQTPQSEDDKIRAFLIEQLMGLDALANGSTVDTETFLDSLENLHSGELSAEEQARLLGDLQSLSQ